MKFGLSFVIKNWHYSTWLVHYLTLQQFVRVFKTYVKKGSVVFDIGCSTKPYSALIKEYSSKYIGLEHLSTFHLDHKADIMGTAYSTGLKNESVDTVFSAAVLEHLEEPSLAIKEMNRILKPEGILILSAPFIWHVHEAPRDFYRYAKDGFEHLLKSNGFEVLEIKALAGFWVTFFVLLLYYVGRFNRGIIKFFPIIPAFILLIQIIAFVLNKIDPKSDIWTWAYVAVGRKKHPVHG
ncbi:MAG: class I SAM-dependent methyltransferase [Chitinivibrionales bacterium]|nr:class I SAM-dependent methyltransferase [Chitinivibrionales bacterium]